MGEGTPPVRATPYLVPVAVWIRGLIGEKLPGLELKTGARERGVPPIEELVVSSVKVSFRLLSMLWEPVRLEETEPTL